MTDERRRTQRLKLSKPILATARGANALVLDIGMSGAFLEHYGTATPGEEFHLSFRWQSDDVEFVCSVAHTRVVRAPAGDGSSALSHTGVRFLEPVGDSRERLHHLMATFIARVLDAQKSNAAGEFPSAGATILANLGGARRARSRGFISYRLKGDTWWRVPAESPRQPADGFTVAEHEDEEEIETLCRTYEAADEDAREMIRVLAELSASGEG
ncbi:MAG TPA: PilZ domain-containing protein [Thermoanaerobaculia bacterium]|jgi:hypothetical protein